MLSDFLKENKKKDEDDTSNAIFSQYAMVKHLRMFLHTLELEGEEWSKEEIDSFKKCVHEQYKIWDNTAKYADAGMILSYAVLMMFTTVGALIFPATATAAESVATSFAWNVGVDSLGGGLQSARQWSRGKKALALANGLNIASMVSFSIWAIIEYSKGNLYKANLLFGWSFAAGMFLGAGIEGYSYWRCCEHKDALIDKLQKKIESLDNAPASLANNVLNLKTITDSVTLVQESTYILFALKANKKNYYECEALLDSILRENAQANNHYRSMVGFIFGGVAMSFAALATTYGAVQSFGGSLLAGTWINYTLSNLSSVIRVGLWWSADDVDNVEEAIKNRNKFLKRSPNHTDATANKIKKEEVEKEVKGKFSHLKFIKHACDAVDGVRISLYKGIKATLFPAKPHSPQSSNENDETAHLISSKSSEK